MSAFPITMFIPLSLAPPALPAVAYAEQGLTLHLNPKHSLGEWAVLTALQLWESQVSGNTQNWICLTHKNVDTTVQQM